MTIPHLAFVGFSGSGKTTLISQVVKQLKYKGYRVGVLKHDAHDFQMDVKGKDTYQYTEAGADWVAISSASKLNILEQLQKPLALDEILQRFSGVDLIMIEGYKQENVPKILIARTLEQLALYDHLSQIIAIASTLHLDNPEVATVVKLLEPFLDLNDIESITAFVESWLRRQEQ
jgi:molybdopterin-guanine dinucleotide biosynthesis adapter protein